MIVLSVRHQGSYLYYFTGRFENGGGKKNGGGMCVWSDQIRTDPSRLVQTGATVEKNLNVIKKKRQKM